MGSTKVDGIYIALRADWRQLDADMKQAHSLVRSSATGMSDALGNALSPERIRRGMNAIVADLGQLQRSSQLTAKDFAGIGLASTDLGARLNLPEKQLAALQTRMLQTQAAEAQVQALRRIGAQAGLTNAELAKLGRDMGVSQANIAKATGGGVGLGVGLASAAATGLVVAATVKSIGQATFNAAMETERLTQAYATIESGTAGARQQLLYLRQESDELGLNFQESAAAAKSFFASGKGTALEGQMRNIFSAVSEAGTALKLSQEEMNGIFLALGQMISKGKVQAEELRGQLGERLPGAFGLAAKAMGVTTGELDKMLESGKVLAEDLLPKLADAMHEKFGKAAMAAAKGGTQEVNRMSTEWTDFKANVLDSDAMIASIRGVTAALKNANEQNVIQKMLAANVPGNVDYSDGFGGGVSFTERQIQAFKEYGTVVTEEINRIEQARQRASLEDYETIGTERAIGKASQLSKDYLKSTESEKVKKIREEARQAIDAQIAARDKDAANAERYNQRIAAIRREEAKQLAEIGKSQRDKTSKAQEERNETIRDVEKENSAIVAQADAVRAEMDALAEASGLFGQAYSDQISLIKAKTKAQDEYVKLTAKGVTQENAGALREATLRRAQFDQDEARRNAAKTSAASFSGPAYEAKKKELDTEYALIKQHADDKLAVDAEYNQKREDLEISRLRRTGRASDGAQAALRNYAKEAGNEGANAFDLWTSSIKSTEDALVQLGTKGEISITSLFETMRAEFLRTQVIRPALAAGGEFLAGLDFKSMFASVFHDGGTVGVTAAPQRLVPAAMFDNAPRYHSGLQSGERAAILQNGEDVISIAQKARLARMAQGGGGGVSIPVTINNNASGSVQVQAREVPTSNGGPGLEIVIDELMARKISTPGTMTSKALRSTWGASRTLASR